MSLTMPSGTVVTASTGVITRQFGDYEMQIEFETSGSPASLTMKMSKLPVMEQKIDLQVEADDLSEIKLNLSDIEFTVFDRLSDGTSLIERISGLGVADAIKVKSTVNGGDDYFLATRSTCRYDWKSRSVTIKAVTPFRYDNVITSYDPSPYELLGETESWIFPKDLITSFLDSQGAGGTSVILGSYFDYTISGVTNPGPLGNKLAFFYNNIDPDSNPANYLNAQDICLWLAITEGAYMGTLFGTKYYVRRNYAVEDTDTYITVGADDIESYELVTNERSIRNYNTLFLIRDQFGQPNDISSYEITQVVSSLGAFNVTLDYRFQDIYDRPEAIVYSIVNNWWVATNATTSNGLIIALNDALVDNSRQSYASALGIMQSDSISYNEMFNVKLTLFGVDSFRPYHFIKFNTGINGFLDNRKLRPSSVKYDLESNKVEVEGYFIG